MVGKDYNCAENVKSLKKQYEVHLKDELKSICHHLVSTLSPLGNETRAMESVKNLQYQLSSGAINIVVSKGLENLKMELRNQKELTKII